MCMGGLCLLVVIVSLGVLEINEKKRIKLKKVTQKVNKMDDSYKKTT